MKKLTILLIVMITLPVNVIASNCVDTTEDISGGFGLKLGARYDQSFIKSSVYDVVPGGSDETGNSIIPSKPIDILSKYELFVTDEKLAFKIIGKGKIGDIFKKNTLCEADFYTLKRALERKYKVSILDLGAYNGLCIENKKQSRNIRAWCNTQLIIRYFDDNIFEPYQTKLLEDMRQEEKYRINSYDI